MCLASDASEAEKSKAGVESTDSSRVVAVAFRTTRLRANGIKLSLGAHAARVPTSSGRAARFPSRRANVFSGATRYLEIAVRQAGNPNPHTILAPREQIASSPYAVRTLSAASADNALSLGGIAASEYVTTTNGGNSFIRNGTTLQTGNFNISGNGQFGGQRRHCGFKCRRLEIVCALKR